MPQMMLDMKLGNEFIGDKIAVPPWC